MEEDINICEEFINLSFLYGKLSFTKTQLYEYQTAIKNLLTRYKQLEEVERICGELAKFLQPIIDLAMKNKKILDKYDKKE